jgi:hypothetical protein
MDYKDYIDLGFERFDMSDEVEFRQTGYYGFCLSKKLNKKISVGVCSGELDRPMLYIKKSNSEDYHHIVTITGEMVRDLFQKNF